MNELIKYFESLEARLVNYETRVAGYEARIAGLEARTAALEAKVKELQNRPLPEPQVIEKIVEKIVEVEAPVAAKEPEVAAAPEPVIEPEIPIEEPVSAPMPEPEPIPEPQTEVATEPESAPAAEKPIVEEPVADPSKAVLYGKPVDDIRQAISLGDRFLYQRELFGQNAELMQKTLTDLNALHSFDEAISYIMTHFHWDAESNTYQQFLVTLHRRFG